MSWEVVIRHWQPKDFVDLRMGGPQPPRGTQEVVCGPFTSSDAAEEFAVAAVPAFREITGVEIRRTRNAVTDASIEKVRREKVEEHLRDYRCTDTLHVKMPAVGGNEKVERDAKLQREQPHGQRCPVPPNAERCQDQEWYRVKGLGDLARALTGKPLVEARTIPQVLEDVRRQLQTQQERLLSRLQRTLEATLRQSILEDSPQPTARS